MNALQTDTLSDVPNSIPGSAPALQVLEPPEPKPLIASVRPSVAILGVPFDNVTTTEAIDLIRRMIDAGDPHYLVTANVDFLVQAREDVELRRILFDSNLVLCDGTPVLWASRLLGNPLPERVAGADLVPLLIELAARSKYRLFFLGATPESSAQAVARLQAQYPELIIAGHYSPPFNKLLEMDHDEIVKRIRAAKPDLLFVSFGCPKQEKWIAMHYRELGVPLCAGVGATIDFLAGSVRRAPMWMRRNGLEWVFRLLQEPRRLYRRYCKDIWVFGGSILGQWWQLQMFNFVGEASHDSRPLRTEESWQCLKLPTRLDLPIVQQGKDSQLAGLREDQHCVLDMSGVRFIDSSGMGWLIRTKKRLAAQSRFMVLLTPSDAVQKAMKLMRLTEFFDSAPDLGRAMHILVERSRELQGAVRPRTAAASGPLVWYGEITAANARDVWQRTETFLGGSKPKDVWTIDLSAVRFIDSSGLGLMVRAKKLTNSRGASLHFTAAQPNVANVIRLSRLEEFLFKDQPAEKQAPPPRAQFR
jgi:N-acetylglucosaminyldiphosphoundecaprenol N-acetyl-beta-D-mannosaminyltransferase